MATGRPKPDMRITSQALAAAARVGADLSAAVRDRAGRIAGREGRGVVTEGDVGRAVNDPVWMAATIARIRNES